MNDHPVDGPAPNGFLSHLHTAEGKGVVRIEATFDAGIDTVWSAITEPRQLVRWLGTFEGGLRLGGQFKAVYFATEWEGSGHIDICEPGRHLRVSMTETGATDVLITELTLSARDDRTVLVFEERGMPLGQLAAYGAGNQMHLEDLAAFLAGAERFDPEARWKELSPSCASRSIDSAPEGDKR